MQIMDNVRDVKLKDNLLRAELIMGVRKAFTDEDLKDIFKSHIGKEMMSCEDKSANTIQFVCCNNPISYVAKLRLMGYQTDTLYNIMYNSVSIGDELPRNFADRFLYVSSILYTKRYRLLSDDNKIISEVYLAYRGHELRIIYEPALNMTVSTKLIFDHGAYSIDNLWCENETLIFNNVDFVDEFDLIDDSNKLALGILCADRVRLQNCRIHTEKKHLIHICTINPNAMTAFCEALSLENTSDTNIGLSTYDTGAVDILRAHTKNIKVTSNSGIDFRALVRSYRNQRYRH